MCIYHVFSFVERLRGVVATTFSISVSYSPHAPAPGPHAAQVTNVRQSGDAAETSHLPAASSIVDLGLV